MVKIKPDRHAFRNRSTPGIAAFRAKRDTGYGTTIVGQSPAMDSELTDK
jgi:hypothetical protein